MLVGSRPMGFLVHAYIRTIHIPGGLSDGSVQGHIVVVAEEYRGRVFNRRPLCCVPTGDQIGSMMSTQVLQVAFE